MATPAEPNSRYSAIEGARLVGSANVELHHSDGHDRRRLPKHRDGRSLPLVHLSVSCRAEARTDPTISQIALSDDVCFLTKPKSLPLAAMGAKRSFDLAVTTT